ncbi:MAG TPA: hypothetical protein VLL52_23775 [Anaerolineae bacterium]|nr:hypothetical protein [Anaerolineae bacterium]
MVGYYSPWSSLSINWFAQVAGFQFLGFSLILPNNWQVVEHERLDNVVTISAKKGGFLTKKAIINISSLYFLSGLIDLSSRDLSFESCLI